VLAVVLMAAASSVLSSQAVKSELPQPSPDPIAAGTCLCGCNQGVGKEVTSGPTGNNLWVTNCMNLNVDVQILGRDIVAYKIKYFNNSWSSWYFPGINDMYQKKGEPCRRVWACFNDHTFMYLYNQY